MSINGCIKFLAVAFLPLSLLAGLRSALAEPPDLNFQSRVDQFSFNPAPPRPVIRSDDTDRRVKRQAIKAHREGQQRPKPQ
jgi:hypothetical protein